MSVPRLGPVLAKCFNCCRCDCGPMPAVLAAGLGPMYLGRFWSVIHAMSMPSPRQPSGKDHWNHWSPYNLTLLQLEQTTGSSGRRGTAPRLSLVSPKVFSRSPIEFWFLAAVASGLLSWGHFISSDIIDLIAQILFKLN